MVQSIQQPTAVAPLRPMPTTIVVFVSHFGRPDPGCSNLSIAKSRAQRGKIETGMLHLN